MKYFKILLIAALAIANIFLIVKVRSLNRDVEFFRDIVARSPEFSSWNSDRQKVLRADITNSLFLLDHLRQSETHPEFLDFLKTIPNNALECGIIECKSLPNLQLFMISNKTKLADGSSVPINDRKTAVLLVKSEKLEVIDCLIRNGEFLGSVPEPIDPKNPLPFPEVQWDLEDGTTYLYRVRPAGFEIID